MDLNCELPIEMKHRIISLLEYKEAARTSILSKSWKFAWDSRPVVAFKDYDHPVGSFASFLDQSLQRFSENQVSVEKLWVCMGFYGYVYPETFDAVCRWVHFALATNLRALTIGITHCLGSKSQVLMEAFSSETLTSLSLFGFNLTLAPYRNWRLPRLQSLSLLCLSLDDSTELNELVSTFPSLEQFNLGVSSGKMTSLELSGIGNLKRVKMKVEIKVRKISLLGASSLEAFTLRGTYVSLLGPLVSDIVLEGCEASLKELRVLRATLSTEWARTQIPKFRGLKVLQLQSILGLSTLKVSNKELIELALVDLFDLGSDPEICALNLQKLEIRGSMCAFDTRVSWQTLESVNIEFYFRTDAYHKAVLFDKLKEFFHKINHINNVVVAFLCRISKIVIVHDECSENLLDTLGVLYDLMSHIEVIISSNRNWEHRVISLKDDAYNIYVASSIVNNNNHFSKNILRKLTSVRRSQLPFRSIMRFEKYARIAMETENDRSEFEGCVDTERAVLEMIHRSYRPYLALNWSGSRS